MIEYYRLIQRRDTAANWTSANPTLEAGEWGYETDTKQVKMGDGTTAWNSLPYFAGAGGSTSWTDITGKPDFKQVATTGDYNDLINKPTIPSPANDGKLVITINGEEQTPFGADSSEDVNIDINTGGNDWFGTQEEYDALTEHDPNTTYHISGRNYYTKAEIDSMIGDINNVLESI